MANPEGNPLHQTSLAVRWGDMDALGHVNNIMYFRYFETARLQWYEKSGFEPLAGSDEGMVIVDNHAQYLKPLLYPATVTVRMAGHSPGRSSFISTYSLSVDDQLYTLGSSKIVWVNMAAGRSVPLPEAVRSMVSDSKPSRTDTVSAASGNAASKSP
jgi:acyl-CoA thioester hydrolase